MAVYFVSFKIEYKFKDVLNKIKERFITHNIFKMQSGDSVMCRFYCIPFIGYIIVEIC